MNTCKLLATEPRRALVADHQGLADIEIIIAQGKNWLKPQGWIALEHGYDQGKLFEIFSQSMVLAKLKLFKTMAKMIESL